MEDRGMSHSLETKAPTETSSEDWTQLPWRKLERYVFRLQKRIYRASGLSTWQRPGSPQIATGAKSFQGSQIAGSAAGNARQPRHEKRGRGDVATTQPRHTPPHLP